MKILVTNDDGIESAGIHALAKALALKNEVFLIAPESERSACSQSLTSMYNVTYKQDLRFDFKAFSCSGTPADCVKLGILHLMDRVPDLVVSGINNGTNLGSDVIYSGTVAAALEGIYMGVPAIAVSTDHQTDAGKLDKIALFIADNLDRFFALDLPKTSALNINYPANQAVKGFKVTPLGMHFYNDGFVRRENGYRLEGTPLPQPEEENDCDVLWYNRGYVTLTPVQNDRNDYLTLKRIRGDFNL